MISAKLSMDVVLQIYVLLVSLWGTSGQMGQLSSCDLGLCFCVVPTRSVDCFPRPQISGSDFKFTSIPQDLPPDTRIL